jgi:hypothetical protein
MSRTAEMAALSEKYSWKNFTTLDVIARQQSAPKTVAIAHTG